MEVIKTFAVVALAASGIVGGYYISRLKGMWWTLGFFIPFIFVVLIGLARRFEALAFIPPFSWLMHGRNEFVIIGPVIGMMLTTPLMHLDSRRKKILLATLMGIVLAYFPVAPFAIPLFMRGYYSRMETEINEDGVCLQSNMFNCGPASAVTALRMLGLDAEEGELAMLAYTTPLTGTPPDLLCNAIRKKYGKMGVNCRYSYFESVDELRDTKGVRNVILRYSILVDHYVTVLDIAEKHVTIGDPLRGKAELTMEDFMRQWRKSAMVITRKPASPK